MIISLDDLRHLQTAKSRLIGLDLGDKTIGVALSDATWTIASPHSLIRRSTLEKDMNALREIFTIHTVPAIIIGFPVNMNGSEGPRVALTREFMEKVDEILGMPIFPWDERLSTMAVTRTLLEADVSRKRRGHVVDKMAATYILQGVLDRLKCSGLPSDSVY